MHSLLIRLALNFGLFQYPDPLQVDINQWPVLFISLSVLYLLHYFHAPCHLPKYCMLVVQPRTWHCSYEKL